MKLPLKTIAIFSSVLTLLLGATIVVVTALGPQRPTVADIFKSSVNLPQQRTIDSSLGFHLAYDANLLDVTGQVTAASSTTSQVTGEEYNGKDLLTRRDYSLVKFQPHTTRSGFDPDLVTASFLTNIHKDYWNSRTSQAKYQGKTKLDILTAETLDIQRELDDKGAITTASSQDFTQDGQTVRRVVFRHTNTNYGLSTYYDNEYYLAVVNDRPYSGVIYNLTTTNQDQRQVYEQVLAGVKFGNIDTKKLSWWQKLVAPAQAAQDTLPSGVANVPNELDPTTLISVVARNQPAAVRIGITFCGDVTLSHKGVDPIVYDRDCTISGGSGAIISGDGYISTNGHVAVPNARYLLQAYLADRVWLYPHYKPSTYAAGLAKYLVAIGSTDQSDSDQLLQDADKGDHDALTKVMHLADNIRTDDAAMKNVFSEYAIQLSNQPIHYDYNTGKLNYGPSIVPASFVASNYDTNESALGAGTSKASDVALLKIDGDFIAANLASPANFNEGQTLTSIGFPAFVDGWIDTKQATTVPSVTQGVITSVDTTTSPGRRVIDTTVPISPGNSGGSAYNTDGKAVGLTTYATTPCEDSKCFGDGILRDIGDLQDLIKAKHIALSTDNAVTKLWEQALADLAASRFDQASAAFKQVIGQQPNNYLAPELLKLADAKVVLGESAEPSVYTSVRSVGRSYGLPIAVAAILVGFIAAGSIGWLAFQHFRQRTVVSAASPKLN